MSNDRLLILSEARAKPVFKTLGPQNAAKLDEELMSSGGFSVDQLMELAGLSVAQAGKLIYHTLDAFNLSTPLSSSLLKPQR